VETRWVQIKHPQIVDIADRHKSWRLNQIATISKGVHDRNSMLQWNTHTGSNVIVLICT
jgi:hypothetical protein